MKKYSKGEITKIVLKTIALSSVVVTLIALPGLAVALSPFIPKNKEERYKLNRTIRRLENKKFIQISNKNAVRITTKGKRLLYKYQFEELTIKKPQKWDKLWHVVAFDIPESKRNARLALHYKLKHLGFYPLQKSMFVFPYDSQKEIDFVGQYFGVRKYITYIVAVKLENENKLKTFFKLT